jgi:hypothetical protein
MEMILDRELHIVRVDDRVIRVFQIGVLWCDGQQYQMGELHYPTTMG